MSKDENKDVEEQLDADEAYYFTVVKGITDNTLLLLKSHLYIEYYMERIIRAYLKRGDRLLDNTNLTFNHKFLILNSFDIVPDEIMTAIKHINAIRNKCSHEFDYIITKRDIENAGMLLKSYKSHCKPYQKDLNKFLGTVVAAVIGGLSFFFERNRRNVRG